MPKLSQTEYDAIRARHRVKPPLAWRFLRSSTLLGELRRHARTIGRDARERGGAWTDDEIGDAKCLRIELGQLHKTLAVLVPVARTVACDSELAVESKHDLDDLQADILARAECWPYSPARFLATLERTRQRVVEVFEGSEAFDNA